MQVFEKATGNGSNGVHNVTSTNGWNWPNQYDQRLGV